MIKTREEKEKIVVYMDGGLASQMTSYVFALSLREKGHDPCFDLSWFNRFGRDRLLMNRVFGIELKECKKLGRYALYNSGNPIAILIRKSKLINFLILIGIIPKIYFTVKPRYYGYKFSVNNVDKILAQNPKSYFWGHWAFSDYIENNKEFVRKVFSFPEIVDEMNSGYLEEIRGTNSVSIHVRKGDFLKYPKVFRNLSFSYYHKAVDLIKTRVDSPVFYIFSNDIEWCMENIKNMGLSLGESVFVSGNSGKNDFIDMQLMSNCKHNIVANSGFSLWAGFLNNYKEKIVVAPKEGYTEDWCRKNEVNLYRVPEKSWILVNN